MRHQETIDKLTFLLNLLYGVRVQWATEVPEENTGTEDVDVCFALHIRDQQSLVHLAYDLMMANLPELAVCVEEFPQLLEPGTETYGGGRVYYRLDSPASSLQGSSPNCLEVLGISLARELKATRRLTAEIPDRLKAEWNAEVM